MNEKILQGFNVVLFMQLIFSSFQSESAGSYRGRLNMPNERQLVISNMRVDDGGTFECEVNYVGSEEVLVRTDVSIVR